MDVRDCLERQRVGAGAADRLGSDGATAHGGFRLVRVCVRARVRGREELGRDGGAEEAGEQVQGAGRQAAAGSGSRSRTPDSSFRLSVLCFRRCA